MKRYKISVTSKVQGVWFRDTARREAEARGLQGFARNEPDGSVYIEAEGNEQALQEFLNWAHQGPREAVVSEVKHSVDDPAGHTGFSTL